MTSTDSNDDLINEAQIVSGDLDNLLDETLTDSSDTDTIQPLQNGALSEVKLIIHNQFPGIELTSPIYAGRHVTCCLLPDQSINVDSTIQADFNIDITQHMPTGVLMYKLQRKNTDQSNEDGISNQNEASCVQFVITWIVKNSKGFFADSYLFEHNEGCVLDRDKMLELNEYYELTNIQYGTIEETWLMHDNTVLMTSLNVTREECYKLEMTISEGSIKDDTQRPHYIDMDK
jgi:hypothetical protein